MSQNCSVIRVVTADVLKFVDHYELEIQEQLRLIDISMAADICQEKRRVKKPWTKRLFSALNPKLLFSDWDFSEPNIEDKLLFGAFEQNRLNLQLSECAYLRRQVEYYLKNNMQEMDLDAKHSKDFFQFATAQTFKI